PNASEAPAPPRSLSLATQSTADSPCFSCEFHSQMQQLPLRSRSLHATNRSVACSFHLGSPRASRILPDFVRRFPAWTRRSSLRVTRPSSPTAKRGLSPWDSSPAALRVPVFWLTEQTFALDLGAEDGWLPIFPWPRESPLARSASR